jgi:hypothetical protein
MFFLVLFCFACSSSVPSDATVYAHRSAAEEGAPTESWYPDADGDGFGDALAAATVASGVSGGVAYVTNNRDCDDGNSARHPNVAEVCNDVDDNCDGDVDNAAVDQPNWYLDLDADGFGDAAVSVQSCDGVSHFVNDAMDCNDEDSSVFPSAPESCNSVDDDCDGDVDEDPTFGSEWYFDADGDGRGGADEDPVVACERPSKEYIPGNTDCNDADPDIHPSADELCNGVDDNCDGEVDNRAVDATTWYGDFDGDGFGDMYGWYMPSVRSCEQPAGYTSDGTDCEDTLSEVNPNAVEICDWFDNDCDGFMDADDPDGVPDASMWYPDMDGDGFGDGTAGTLTCEYNAVMSSGGWSVTTNSGDCDDTRLTIPGLDSDHDGYDWCNGECDDFDWRVNPGAVEISNGYDDDCDEDVDEVE